MSEKPFRPQSYTYKLLPKERLKPRRWTQSHIRLAFPFLFLNHQYQKAGKNLMAAIAVYKKHIWNEPSDVVLQCIQHLKCDHELLPFTGIPNEPFQITNHPKRSHLYLTPFRVMDFLVSWIEIARCSKASRFEHSILRWIDENLAPSAIEITTKSSVTCDMEIGDANSMDKSKLNEANVSDLSLWICENEAVFMSLLYLGHIFFCTFFGDSPCSLYCSEYCGNHFAVRREIVFSNFGSKKKTKPMK